MATQVEVKQWNLPEGWSQEAAEFINQVCLYHLIKIVNSKKTRTTFRAQKH